MLYHLMASGALPFVKLGKCRRVSRAELLRLVEGHTHGGRRRGP
jgi:hypothetical protein